MNKFNLLEIRKKTGITQQELADGVNLSRKTINTYEKTKEIPPNNLLVIKKYFEDNFPNVTFSYMAKSTNETQPRISYETEKGRPFYNADWTLSFKEVNDDTVFHPEFNIDFPPANKEGVNWFRTKGNSMIEINSGDYVALEKIEDFSWFPLGRIYGIITSNGFRTIKKIVQSDIKENYLLKASNPNKEDHPDQDIPKEMITGLYKIIYVIKDLDE